MSYIKLEDLQKFPIRKDHYDKEHGSEQFVNGVEAVLEYAEYLPHYTLDDAESKLVNIVQAAIHSLEGMESQLDGGEDRPHDLMYRGCIDGIYNTWIEVLDILGVEHLFEKQPI